MIFLGNVAFLEAQTLVQARAWFNEGEYRKALPVFRSELSKNSKDPSLNLWYGVCLMKTGESQEALSHLLYAKRMRLPNADLYLAYYYMDVHKPDTSLIYIDNYLTRKNLSPSLKSEAINLKDSVNKYLELLQRVEDVCFIDSVTIPKKDMYKTVRLSREAGSIKPVESVFGNNTDNEGIAYFPEKNDRVYYAGKIPGNQADIIARHRLLDQWDKPEPLPENINGPGNELNPFFLQDGVTLYFASDGPKSMGGLDIFVTRLNPSTGEYLLPDRLNMPFNSTANEYFLIIDEFRNRGYLCTDRNSKKGFVTIYTFIPPATKTILKNKSVKELQDFADIKSIRATWAGRNMDSLMRKPSVVAPVVNEQTSSAKITFRINDSLTYTKVSDFKSAEAQKVFQNYCSDLRKISDMEKDLDDKRQNYDNITEEEEKNRIGAEILNLEKELPALEKELKELEIEARNLEIKGLGK